MIATRIRLLLCIELIAYYFAAPYIILLGLDEHRGLLGVGTSMNIRLWGYALLVGIYPFLQIIVSPYVGRQLDQRQSKISVLRKIHLANCICYLMLAVAAWQHNFTLAVAALIVPGVIGCAAPIGKSLISSLTRTEQRVEQFALLAFMKGIVKLTVPLLGALIFEWLLGQSGYAPLFLIPCVLSFGCFLYSFTFPHICIASDAAPQKKSSHTFSLFVELVRKNYSMLFVFVFLLTGYSVFVKFTPLIIFEKLGEKPSLVNYFASLVGLAYSLNQFIVVRYAKLVENVTTLMFAILCLCTLVLCVTASGPLWFAGLFAVLFCFSALATCIEARLSLQAVSSNQGTVQGIVYSMENWSYLLAPVIGSLVASFSTLYPLYFVTMLALSAALMFAYSQIHLKRSISESYIKAG